MDQLIRESSPRKSNREAPPKTKLYAPKVLFGILLLTIIAFLNASQGGFVYDDRHQLLENPFVQQPHLLAEGLKSDVWAFKGPGYVWSNYWRPGFIFWSFLNWQVFGPEPLGWHLSNLGLHLLAVVLAFNLLRRLRLPAVISGFACLFFAIHPSKAESVTWIAGSPDLLASIALLASLHRFISWREIGRRQDLLFSLLLYVAALLCKEAFLATLFLYPVVAKVTSRKSGDSLSRLSLLGVPYVIAGIGFMLARFSVLGFFSRPFPNSLSWAQTILTAPRVLLFYVRSAVWPSNASIQYDLTPIAKSIAATPTYWIEVALASGILVATVLLCRCNRRYLIGFGLFYAPLLPAFVLRAFKPDDLVHDRYLYLPSLGAGIILGMIAYEVALTARRMKRFPVRPLLIGIATLTSVGFIWMVHKNNLAFRSDVTLWEQASANASTSRTVWTELGSAYQQDKRPEDAENAIETGLKVGPPAENTYAVYGMAAKDRGNLEVALQRLKLATNNFPNYSVGWEQLAVVQEMMGDTNGELETFKQATKFIPNRADVYIVNSGVALAKAGRGKEAISIFQNSYDRLKSSRNPQVLNGLYYLGSLLLEAGQPDKAKDAFQSFVEATKKFGASANENFVKDAELKLESLH